MSSFKSPLFIVNPRSSGGLSPNRLRKIELKIRAAFPDAKIHRTTGPKAAVRMAMEARQNKVEALGVVGGDGTINEVVNGLMLDCSDPYMPSVAILPTGTGCDLAKSLDIPKDIDLALEIMQSGRVFKSDVGRIQYTSQKDGSPITYYFINMGGFGAPGELVKRVNNSSKRLGGFVSFAIATITTTTTYPGCKVRLKMDDGEFEEHHLNALMVANGQYQGGGMRPGKDARMDDGRFKVISIAQKGAVALISRVNRLYSGDFDSVSFIDVGEASRIEALPLGKDKVLLEADGEQPGCLPATFDLVKQVIPFCIGEDAVALG